MKTILVINRLCAYFKAKTSIALAKELGISPTTLANWKKRNSIDWILVFTKCETINLNWLIRGDGEMLKGEPVVESKKGCESSSEAISIMLRQVQELTVENHELKRELDALKAEKKIKKSVSYDIAAEREPELSRKRK